MSMIMIQDSTLLYPTEASSRSPAPSLVLIEQKLGEAHPLSAGSRMSEVGSGVRYFEPFCVPELLCSPVGIGGKLGSLGAAPGDSIVNPSIASVASSNMLVVLSSPVSVGCDTGFSTFPI